MLGEVMYLDVQPEKSQQHVASGGRKLLKAALDNGLPVKITVGDVNNAGPRNSCR